MTRARVIVFGLMFDLPYAGIVAQFVHYLIGLRDLGHDVWYVEDSLSWPYDPSTRTVATAPSQTIASVGAVLARYGFDDRWIYRCAIPDVTCYGGSQAELDELYRSADVALNVTGAQEIRDEHAVIRRLVYVQSDPFGLQIDIDNGDEWALDQLMRHGAHFTFGELVGTPSCALPTAGVTWRPTRQPVALSLWTNTDAPGDRFTTVTTWRNDTKHKLWNGERYYWTKDREFLAIADLPVRSAALLELAVDGPVPESATLTERGWRLVHRADLAVDFDAYRAYIIGSRGEFTVARDQVVRPRTGWFSDRSACYLAAGRAVVTQDTGFGEVLPLGEGLFAFDDLASATEAIAAIEADPTRHGRAAREIAAEYFRADKVVEQLLEAV